MIISDKILYLRKKLNFTQEELAEQLNVSRQSISKWEGAQSIPDISKIMAMAKLFSVSTDYLLCDEIETIGDNAMSAMVSDKSETVTIEIANSFISNYLKHIKIIAFGVFLCIFAAVPLITISGFEKDIKYENLAMAFGLGFLLISIIVAVGLFIYSDSIMEQYKYICNGQFELSYNVSGIIKEYQKIYRPIRTKKLIISVTSIMISILPLIITSMIFKSEELSTIMTAMLIVCVAVMVFRIICSEGKKECYEILLQEGDFRKSNEKSNNKKAIVEGVYWSLASAAYILWSFTTNDWHITWIVWPVAALLSTTLNLLWINENK